MNRQEMRSKLMYMFDLKTRIDSETKEFKEACLMEYKEFISCFKTVFLFGSGVDGRMAYDYLEEILKDKSVYFIDNNAGNHGKEICRGIYCYGMNKMYGCNEKDTLILITTSKFADEIINEIRGAGALGYQTSYQKKDKLGRTYIDASFIKLLCGYKNIRGNWLRSSEHIRVFDLLTDDISCEIYYHRLIRVLFSGNLGMHQFVTLPQYFPREIKERFTDDEVFLDCGASYGDTVEEFFQQTNGHFKKIYSFEMDDEIYNTLCNNPITSDERVVCINAGVSDCDHRIKYRKDGCPSYAVLYNSEDLAEADLKSIDGLVSSGIINEKITFVKMDIEGAELDALRGMKKVMKRDKPKLAICIYHKGEDMWEIPLYIHSLVPEYKFIVRQHEHLGAETVLYAYL